MKAQAKAPEEHPETEEKAPRGKAPRGKPNARGKAQQEKPKARGKAQQEKAKVAEKTSAPVSFIELGKARQPGMELNFFRLLSVGRACTTEQVHAAFKRLALVHHPDKGCGRKGSPVSFSFSSCARLLLSLLLLLFVIVVVRHCVCMRGSWWTCFRLCVRLCGVLD